MSALPHVPTSTGSQPRPERRRSTRRAVLIEQIVPVSLTGDNGGLVLDLGESGLAVQAVAPLQPGATAGLEFALPGGARIRARGDVRWAEPSGRAGIRLFAFQEGSAEVLRSWVVGAAAGAPAPQHPLPPAAPTSPGLGLAEVENRIARGLDLDGALQLIAERTLQECGATGAAIALGQRDELTCRASRGAAPSLGVRLQAGSGLSGVCVRTGLPVRCDDTETDPRVDASVCRSLDLRSAILVPIHGSEGLRGVLEVFSDRPRAFGAADLNRLRGTTALIAAVVSRFAAPVVATAAPAEPLEPASAAPPAAVAAGVRIPPAAPPEAPRPEDLAAVAANRAISPDLETAKMAEAAVPTPEAAAVTPAAVTEPVPAAISAEPSRPMLFYTVRFTLVVVSATAVVAGGWAVLHRRQVARPAAGAGTAATAVPPARTPAEVAPTPVVSNDPAPSLNAARGDTGPVSSKPKRANSPVIANVPEAVIRQPRQIQAQAPISDAGTPPRLIPGALLPSLGAPQAAAPEAPASQRRSEGVVPGRLVSGAQPVYPEVARRLQIKGDVLLTAVVRVDGTIGAVQVVKGNAILARAALDAVRRWRYQPYKLNGSPQEAVVSIRFHFDPHP